MNWHRIWERTISGVLTTVILLTLLTIIAAVMESCG